MGELHSTPKAAGPFGVAPSQQEPAVTGKASPTQRIARQALVWSRHLLTGVGILTVVAFIAGVTPIPEQIGGVTGRIAAAATRMQIDTQTRLQAAVTAAQQQAGVGPQQQIQAWQAGLQADLATLTSALDGTKTLLITKAGADLQERNSLLDKNAQLQSDRVHQIMEVRGMLEQGNITSAQIADFLKNLGNGLQMDTTQLRQQSDAIKADVMDKVSQVTPISEDNGSGITDPIKPGGILDPDVQGALSDLERRVSAIQERFAIRTMPPSPPIQAAKP